MPDTATTKTVLKPRSEASRTSIKANLVTSISVTMSYAEMDTLYSMVSKQDTYVLSEGERAVRDEFMNAVDSVR